MSLPERVRIKVLSDAAGFLDVTRVSHQEVPFAQVLDLVVAVAGLDAARVAAILRAGAAVSGGYRYRWPPLVASESEIAPLLENFPKPDPRRPFDASRCLLARVRAGVETIELPREMAARRRRSQLETFWDHLMAVCAGHPPAYAGYSYRDAADLYTLDLTSDMERGLRQAGPLLAVDRVAEQITGLPLEKITFYVKR
jgi:hypothetical protein